MVAVGNVRNGEAGDVMLDVRHAEGARTDASLGSIRPYFVEAQTSMRKTNVQWAEVDEGR